MGDDGLSLDGCPRHRPIPRATTPMPTPDLDAIRESVLDRMERDARNVKLAVLTGAALEAVLGITALRLVDWHDRTQVLVLVVGALIYSILVLGLIALGAHGSRNFVRVLAALDAGEGARAREAA
jgi:hypothetical protein